MKDYILGGEKPLGLAIDVVRGGVEAIVPQTQQKKEELKLINFVVPNEITDDVKNKVVDYGLSELGTPVYSQITFGLSIGSNNEETTTYIGFDGLTHALPIITFQAILISVSFPRNIVKTAIQGKNGTVKEYIGEGDATISFRGVITGANGHYPKDEVNALKMLIKAPISVPVISDYLNNLDIYNVVFDDRSLEQEEGGYSYQTFTLNAISDVPIDLHIL